MVIKPQPFIMLAVSIAKPCGRIECNAWGWKMGWKSNGYKRHTLSLFCKSSRTLAAALSVSSIAAFLVSLLAV
jgi:hypothetical protein